MEEIEHELLRTVCLSIAYGPAFGNSNDLLTKVKLH
jgi:hypothetical protein